ncbi:thioredoxin family protein [Mycoplasmopsis columbina]|uniref:Putative thioredoxin n=1 Tax=Mycoplasmopsis columbina SF7 TaxID=1037410 RepID=F9UJU7_9BACT|nr:thioredoxin family protein [Mycoplasmopsis columbina]EGV00293.1 putative thioredoxin [Mycoplasmopsis columbina SF7]VEU76843.1 Thioredoxin [Mycoplasmopsis columbina]
MEKIKFDDLNEIIGKKENTNVLFFIEFSTTWCPDCKMMQPIVKSLFNDYHNNPKVKFLEIDAEEAHLYKDPFSKWQILKVPAFVFYKNNEILKIVYEYYPKELLAQFIEDYID